MRVTGIVAEVDAGIARIECSPAASPACAACGAGRGCGWQRSSRPRQIELPAEQLGPRIARGDRLELEVDETQLLGAAFRLYLPPLAGVLAGPVVARLAGLEQGALPLIAAAIGLGLGLAVAWRWTRSGVSIRWQPLPASEP